MPFNTHLYAGGNPHGAPVPTPHRVNPMTKFERDVVARSQAQHLKEMTPSIDNAMPTTLLLGHKAGAGARSRVFMEEQRVAGIERDNNILLQKLSQIANPKSMTKGTKARLRGEAPKHGSVTSLHAPRMRREQERIADENARMMRRIQLAQTRKNEFNRDLLESEWQKKREYRKLASFAE